MRSIQYIKYHSRSPSDRRSRRWSSTSSTTADLHRRAATHSKECASPPGKCGSRRSAGNATARKEGDGEKAEG